MFMGGEIAQEREWNHDGSVEWHLLQDPERRKLGHYLETLGRLYLSTPALWENDPSPYGFEWIDCADHENSVLSYVRRSGDEHAVVVLNLTPVPRESYRVGMPEAGQYVELLSSDDPDFGGSEVETRKIFDTEPVATHGRAQSATLTLPPLGMLVFGRAG
jgi:1,4-alpha-glucan branching enzyme